MLPEWYTADPQRIGFSEHLSPMHDSPLAFAARVARGRDGSARTSSQRTGSATHALLLEGGAAFRSRYVVTDVRRDARTAAYRQVLDEAAGRQVLSTAEHDTARSIATSVRSHPWVAAFLDAYTTGGWRMVVEQPLKWSESLHLADRPAVVPVGVDPFAGIEQATVECKGIVDALSVNRSTGRGIIIDAKQVPTTNLRPLFSHIEKRLYHVQAAHYLAGASTLLPGISFDYYWLAYEGNAPHDAVVVHLSEDDAVYGAAVRLQLLQRIVDARRTGRYPGRHSHVVESSLPAWETRNDNIEEVF